MNVLRVNSGLIRSKSVCRDCSKLGEVGFVDGKICREPRYRAKEENLAVMQRKRAWLSCKGIWISSDLQ